MNTLLLIGAIAVVLLPLGGYPQQSGELYIHHWYSSVVESVSVTTSSISSERMEAMPFFPLPHRLGVGHVEVRN